MNKGELCRELQNANSDTLLEYGVSTAEMTTDPHYFLSEEDFAAGSPLDRVGQFLRKQPGFTLKNQLKPLEDGGLFVEASASAWLTALNSQDYPDQDDHVHFSSDEIPADLGIDENRTPIIVEFV